MSFMNSNLSECSCLQEAERLNEEKFSVIFHTSPDSITLTRMTDGICLEANQAFVRITGYEVNEVIGKSGLELQVFIEPKDRERMLSKLWNEGQLVGMEIAFRRKDGSLRTGLVSARTLSINGDLCILAITRDITDRKLAEAKIREQAALLDIAQDAILVTDWDGYILFWNQSASRLYGWSSDEALGRDICELLSPKEDSGARLARDHVHRYTQWTGEMAQTTRQGQRVQVHSRWTAVLEKEGLPNRIMIVNTDLTEHKQLETRFLRAQRMESIGTLASGIAHDINNVLAPVLMGAQLLKTQIQDEANRKVLDTIESSAQRGANIIRQLLTFARGVAGEYSLIQPVQIIEEMVRIARETFPKSIELQVNAPDELWMIRGDATQLHQVILNLCVNARDVMLQGGVLTISGANIELRPQDLDHYKSAKPGSYVMLSVKDTGPGMVSELMEKIFDPFFTTKELGEGSGLGLSTAAGIIKSHHGFIHVKSQVGHGSEFQVFLPAAAAAISAANLCS